MSCNYCWNQPKKYGKYDMYLDGKLTANEVIYKTVSESGKKENVNLDTKIKEIEERLKVHFTFQTVTELPEVGEETVIYLVSNEKNSGDKDSYNEYMWVKNGENEGKFELIGSGTYAKQTADLYKVTGYTTFDTFDDTVTDGVDINSRINKEIADRIADVNVEEKRATDKENDIVKRLTTITGYDYDDDVTTKGGNIDTRIANEIKNREDDVDAEEKRAIEAENKLFARIETIENYDIDSRVKQLEINLPAEKERAEGEEKRIEKKLNQEIEYRTAQINGLNQEAKQNRNRIIDLESKVSTEINRAIEAENNLLKKFDDYATTTVLEENYSTKAELNAVDKKYTSLEEQITLLNGTITLLNNTITQLEDRIAALEPKPEEPENGEVTDPTETGTPTE